MKTKDILVLFRQFLLNSVLLYVNSLEILLTIKYLWCLFFFFFGGAVCLFGDRVLWFCGFFKVNDYTLIPAETFSLVHIYIYTCQQFTHSSNTLPLALTLYPTKSTLLQTRHILK